MAARERCALGMILALGLWAGAAAAADSTATQFVNILASRYPDGTPGRELPQQNIGFSRDRNRAYFTAIERLDLAPGGATLGNTALFAFDRQAQRVQRLAVTEPPGNYVRRRICYAPRSDYAVIEGIRSESATDPGNNQVDAWLANVVTGQVEPLPTATETGASYRYGGFCFANARDGSAFTFIGQLPYADGTTGGTFVAVLDTTQRPLRVRACGDAREYRSQQGEVVQRSIPVQYLRDSRQVVLRGTLTAPSDRSIPLSILDCGNSNLNRPPVTPSPTAEIPGLVGQGFAYEQLSNDGITATISGFRAGSFVSYVVDRVARQILVAPEDIGAASLPNGLSEDGRFLVVSRSFGNPQFELAVVDIGSRRAATFLLRPDLQPFESFTGDSFQFSEDGSLVSYRGGGADFAPVPGGNSQQVYVSSNPFYADAMPQRLTDLASASATTAVSDDARFVVFDSALAGLDPAVVDNNNASDVFLRDRDTGLLRTLSASGGQARGGVKPTISGDGTRVAYVAAAAGGRTDIVVRELATGVDTSLAGFVGGAAANATLGDPSLSGDGQRLAFVASAPLLAADTDALADVYRIDLRTREIGLASGAATGTCRGARMARGTDVVAFECGGSAPTAQAQAKTAPLPGAVVNLYDFIQRKFEVLSRPPSGGNANGGSNIQGISSDGNRVLFGSDASNLVGSDSNGTTDLFLVDRAAAPAPRRVALQRSGAQLTLPVESAALSPNGNAIAYTTRSGGIDPLGRTGATTALYLASSAGGDARQVRRGNQSGFSANTAAPALNFDGAEVVFGADAGGSGGGTPSKAGTGSLNVANNPTVGTDGRTLSSASTGLWYNPAQDLQGFLVESAVVNGMPTALVSWYVYQGGQAAWLFGSAPLAPGSTNVPLVITRGANFSPNFNPASVVTENWGTVTLKFVGPNRAIFAWSSSYPGYSTGIATLQKLANAADPTSDRAGEMPACVSGTWYDPSQDRQGLQVQKIAGNPATLVALWYSYDQGRQFWLSGQGPINGDRAVLTMRSYRGAQFPPDYRTSDVVERVWGTVQFDRTGNDSARIQWSPSVSGFSAGSMNLTRLSTLTGRPCR